MEIFQIEDVSFQYPGSTRAAISHVSLQVSSGEFLVLCGPSGCGKTTLIRHLKTALAPFGDKEGRIRYQGTDLDQVSPREQAAKIGYVMQNPEHQIVTDKVWHELAFGLENLGYESAVIRRRVAEMASFFGIGDWYEKGVEELSGGQKQLLNLAAIMAMEPDVLVLDEPTSQLDPIAASEFLQTLSKINRELGTTIILAEHRLEEVYSLADRMVVLQEGKILVQGKPEEAARFLMERGLTLFLPAAARIWGENGGRGECPLTVREGKKWLEERVAQVKVRDYDLVEHEKKENSDRIVLEAKEVWYRYERQGEDVVSGLNLSLSKGEWYCLLGGNGAGKTTALSLLAGQRQPYRGWVKVHGKKLANYGQKELYQGLLGVLPQNPQCIFLKDTVREDLEEMKADGNLLDKMIRETGLTNLLDRHPYDLSGGEQQRAALAKVLLTSPEILLLDEPTKGMDGYHKQELAEILKEKKRQGCTILMVSHDVEFCAAYGDTCGLLFQGDLCSQEDTRHFFAANYFYTTAAGRIARDILQNTVTTEQVRILLGREESK